MFNQSHSHEPEDIKARLSQGPGANYLREWVYGGIDGVVTTFAIVAGVTGANLSPNIVIILGIANLIGDGFSMAASAYSGAKTEVDNYERLRNEEQQHIDMNPQGEKEEIRQIFISKGFKGRQLENIVETISKNRAIWVDIMLHEEYAISPLQKKPYRTGLHTFASFIVCGAIPLLPFIFHTPHTFGLALLLSSFTFFGIGTFKSQWSVHKWWKQGFQTLLIGLTAAGLAFVIGYILHVSGL